PPRGASGQRTRLAAPPPDQHRRGAPDALAGVRAALLLHPRGRPPGLPVRRRLGDPSLRTRLKMKLRRSVALDGVKQGRRLAPISTEIWARPRTPPRAVRRGRAAQDSF